MNELVSIIVPVYNVEKFVRQCLDSIIYQTYQNLEILLIDDGSTDCCGAICDKYAEIDNRIIVVHKENAGVSVARNEGINLAKGEWIMFVDPDDWLELDCCEKAIQEAIERDCDVIYFQRDERDDNGLIVQIYPERITGFIKEEEIKEMQLSICAGNASAVGFESATPWGKLYRSTFLKDHKCLFPIGIKIRQDVIFNLFCLKFLKKAYYLDYIGYHYRHNKNSICSKYNPNILSALMNFMEKLNMFITENYGNDSKYEKAFGKYILVVLGDVERLYFFHPLHFISFHTYETDLNKILKFTNADYYFKKYKLYDICAGRQYISFYLLKNHHWLTYYCLKYINSYFKDIKRRLAYTHSLRRNGDEYENK